jgi:hypothetical protein
VASVASEAAAEAVGDLAGSGLVGVGRCSGTQGRQAENDRRCHCGRCGDYSYYDRGSPGLTSIGFGRVLLTVPCWRGVPRIVGFR